MCLLLISFVFQLHPPIWWDPLVMVCCIYWQYRASKLFSLLSPSSKAPSFPTISTTFSLTMHLHPLMFKSGRYPLAGFEVLFSCVRVMKAIFYVTCGSPCSVCGSVCELLAIITSTSMIFTLSARFRFVCQCFCFLDNSH